MTVISSLVYTSPSSLRVSITSIIATTESKASVHLINQSITQSKPSQPSYDHPTNPAHPAALLPIHHLHLPKTADHAVAILLEQLLLEAPETIPAAVMPEQAWRAWQEGSTVLEVALGVRREDSTGVPKEDSIEVPKEDSTVLVVLEVTREVLVLVLLGLGQVLEPTMALLVRAKERQKMELLARGQERPKMVLKEVLHTPRAVAKGSLLLAARRKERPVELAVEVQAPRLTKVAEVLL